RLEHLAGTSDIHFAPTLLLGLATPRAKPLEKVLHTFKVDTQLTLSAGPDTPPAVTWIHRFLPPANSTEFLGRLDAYDVTAVLGQGGMGVVLKAFAPALKRWVAIKVLSPHLASDTVSRQRFAREGQAVAAIRHENVVAVHAVRELKDLPFIVMEYLDGGSLD